MALQIYSMSARPPAWLSLTSCSPSSLAQPECRSAARRLGASSNGRLSVLAVSSDVSAREAGISQERSGSSSISKEEDKPSRGSYSKSVLITGSTKGVGLALAREFLQAGDKVLVTSRDKGRVSGVTEALRHEFSEERVWGIPCNVSDAASVALLAEFARDKMGKVDVWINNAGTNAYSYGPLIDSDDEDIKEIVSTNVLGIMLCCREAIKLMKERETGGHIFNMDGAGADGNPTPRFAAYGATKRSLAQFTSSLQAELKMLGISNVVVHNLSPGMVTTELLMSGANTSQAKFFINALAEPAEDVAKFLVPRVRDVVNSSSLAPSYIKFLTRQKALSQIFQRLLFKSRKGRYVPED